MKKLDDRVEYLNGLSDHAIAAQASKQLGIDVSPASVARIRGENFGDLRVYKPKSKSPTPAHLDAMIEQLEDRMVRLENHIRVHCELIDNLAKRLNEQQRQAKAIENDRQGTPGLHS